MNAIFQFEQEIYLLVNPWLSDDLFSVESTEHIDEYILSEHGRIYIGSADRPQWFPWYFGQFEPAVLFAAMHLLEKSSPSLASSQNEPALILRHLCSKIRTAFNDRTGVFTTSSIRRENMETSSISIDNSSPVILNEFLRLTGDQIYVDSRNWQHAAILCSLFRALGIPSRIVTVYNAICGTEEYQSRHVSSNSRILVQSKQTR